MVNYTMSDCLPRWLCKDSYFSAYTSDFELAEPLCRFLITPITPIIPIIPIILIAPVTPIKIFAVLYCGMIAFWVYEGRFRQKTAKKSEKKVRKNLAVDEKGRTFALAFRE